VLGRQTLDPELLSVDGERLRRGVDNSEPVRVAGYLDRPASGATPKLENVTHRMETSQRPPKFGSIKFVRVVADSFVICRRPSSVERHLLSKQGFQIPGIHVGRR